MSGWAFDLGGLDDSDVTDVKVSTKAKEIKLAGGDVDEYIETKVTVIYTMRKAIKSAQPLQSSFDLEKAMAR